MSTSPGSQTASIARPATSTASASLLTASANRRGFIIVNDSAGKLYVNFAATAASATAYTILLAAAASYEQHDGTNTYSGPITGILDTGTGSAQVTAW